jgi:membrane protein DedA with SNARE-associated domain
VDEARRRRRLTFLLVPIALLVVATNVGSALFPTLSTQNPLLLLALDARNRNIILVANQLDAVPYYVVGTLRLFVSDPLFYLLGFWYGEAALQWVERKTSSGGQYLRLLESFFAKAAYPLVFLAPNNYFCLFAGASRMPPAVFLALDVSGTIARLVLIRAVGDVFESPIDAVLGFMSDNRWPLTALTVALVAGQLLLDRRKGTDELSALADLEEAVEQGAAEQGGADREAVQQQERRADAPDEQA